MIYMGKELNPVCKNRSCSCILDMYWILGHKIGCIHKETIDIFHYIPEVSSMKYLGRNTSGVSLYRIKRRKKKP